jgi:hypothetical protein
LIVAVAVLALLGRWQWDRGLTGGDLRNTFYGLQWWVFAAVAVFAWVKTLHTEAKHGPAVRVDTVEAIAGVGIDGAGVEGDIFDDPRLSVDQVIDRDEAEDDDVAAYNRYLEDLAARHEAHAVRRSQS